MTERPPTPREVFTGRIEAGQFKPDTVARYRGRLARFEGKRITVSLEPERKHRSLNANRRYWGLVIEAMSEWSGFERDECHALLKSMFAPLIEKHLPTGEVVSVPQSTAGMSTEEFFEYTSRCERWLAGQGVYLEATA